MRLDLADLPRDPDLLAGLVRDLAGALDAAETAHAEVRGEVEALKLKIAQLERARYGARSEKLDPDQLALGLEDLEADVAAAEERATRPGRPRAEAPEVRRRALPEHLPREEVVIATGHDACPCCGGVLHEAGETVSEMLDYVPASFRVVRLRRPKLACRACGHLDQASAPERVVAKGLATPALLAHVLVAKYCDHAPLYRQAQIFRRHGVELGRATLAGWVGGACWWLEGLHRRLAAHVFASGKIFADDTPLPVLDPGRGRTKTGRLWAYARDDRPWGGPDPPAAVFFYAPDRKAERPAAHLAAFRGVLQVDAYAGFERLAEGGGITIAACWSHARRRFYELHEGMGSPIAGEVLRRMAELYRVEAEIRGRSADERRSERQERSRPLVAALYAYLVEQLARVPGRGRVAEAIRYALSRWEALCLYLDDGRVEMDTNTVERAIRPVALTRKNSLFAGSDGGGARWAVVASLIETAKLNGVEPYAYLADVLARVSTGHPARDLDALLPWNWTPAVKSSEHV